MDVTKGCMLLKISACVKYCSHSIIKAIIKKEEQETVFFNVIHDYWMTGLPVNVMNSAAKIKISLNF